MVAFVTVAVVIVASIANAYVSDGLSHGVRALFAAANLTPREALRTSKSPAEQLGLADPTVSDEAILTAMLKHPVLVNRPIVCTKKGVALCRPSEVVFSLLDVKPRTTFTKEDGEVVTAP